MTAPSSRRGLLVGNDLFFGSKITGTAAELGGRVEVAGSTEQAARALSESAWRLVLVDLALPGLDLRALMAALPREPRPTVVAFGSHVHTRLLQEARDAGCDEVLPRGRLSAHLPELLTQWLGTGGADSEDL